MFLKFLPDQMKNQSKTGCYFDMTDFVLTSFYSISVDEVYTEVNEQDEDI